MVKGLSILTITILTVLIFGNPVLAGDLTAGLVAHWTFEEGAGDVVYDSSPYANDGVLLNAPTWIPGLIGDYAIHFTGANDRVEVPDSNTLDITGSITVSAWAKTETIYERQVIVCKNAAYRNSWILEVNPLDFEGTKFNFYIDLFGFDGNFGSSTPVSPNQWYHIVCTYDGSERRIYIDGQLDAAQTISGAIPTNDEPVRIGAYAGSTRLFEGDIDNIRIYNRALSDEEVWQLYVDDLAAAGYPPNLIIAIINIHDAIAEKLGLLETANAALELEYMAYDALEQLLESGDYGDLTKADIVKAKQEIHSAIQHQEQSLNALQKSIERLEAALNGLGVGRTNSRQL